MAIVEMNKFTLFVFSETREDLLRELQRFKYVHFLDLKENEKIKEWGLTGIDVEDALEVVDDDLHKLMFSINELNKYTNRQNIFQKVKNGSPSLSFEELGKRAITIDFLSFYKQVRKLVSQKEHILYKQNQIKAKIELLTPWIPLHVPVELLYSIKTCDVITGRIPKRFQKKVELQLASSQYTYFSIIGEDQDFAYLLSISDRSETEHIRKILKAHEFTRITLIGSEEPKETIVKLKKDFQEEQKRLADLKNQFQQLTEKLTDLEIVYEYYQLKKMRLTATKNYVRTDYFNIIEGYIPKKLADDFQKRIEQKCGDDYYLEMREAGKNDPNVPILLENSRFARSFESLTAMYALPKYGEIDPTPLFSIFYLIFFGMMVADIGYGLILLVGTFGALKLLKLTQQQKNFLQFFYYLSYSTIFWGIVYGSFFGDLIPLPSLINMEEQYNLLLVLSIAFGIMHIFFALGVRGYLAIKNGRLLDAIFDAGFWFLALGGGIAFVASLFLSVPPSIEKTGLVMMVIGMIGILFTGGRNSKSIGGKIGGGLYTLYGISGYVGDFVSYSRLMALGLSSAFIASAINMMVGMLFKMGIIGIIFGLIVFVVGQAFNIFLSLLGSYVHTIRLTYVEFFGKFYEGGGKAFQTFRSDSKYIHIK
ncbi:V-type ATP synthase subunit I [Fervidibacillus halotolerans]|uniref:V-type ATP synthase subunit I n=1 Tax=Fervidibacillus halotolerans TaxID=2980027 RepID=A0A9E8LXW9_9BACI|nr:V-type ATP synthase subunit I [Fervidibacillus halotolerans]WAA11725.1 V-type ATP synthase subunit I [Fervidibacillus halotolerans]